MIHRYQRELFVALAYGAVLAVLAVAAPSFYRGNQFLATLVQSTPVVVIAVGMTLVILARHIDISVGSQFALCGVAAGLLAKAGLPLPLVAALTIALGACLGAVNGFFVARLQLPSIVVTLATMVIFRESLRWAREGAFVRDLPPGFQWFGLSQSAGAIAIITTGVLVVSAFAWVLKYLAWGRTIYATGSDPDAAFLAGIRPSRVTFQVFAAAGVLTALAAILHSVRFSAIDPQAGTGLELAAISAVVLGGVAISGGRGTLVGPLLGVLLLATIRPALVFLGAEAHWEKAIQGAVILVAVSGDAFKLRRAHAQLAAA
jgi:rhamnose transport system permease protein